MSAGHQVGTAGLKLCRHTDPSCMMGGQRSRLKQPPPPPPSSPRPLQPHKPRPLLCPLSPLAMTQKPKQATPMYSRLQLTGYGLCVCMTPGRHTGPAGRQTHQPILLSCYSKWHPIPIAAKHPPPGAQPHESGPPLCELSPLIMADQPG